MEILRSYPEFALLPLHETQVFVSQCGYTITFPYIVHSLWDINSALLRDIVYTETTNHRRWSRLGGHGRYSSIWQRNIELYHNRSGKGWSRR